jgi:peptide/nickel transport system permease protein
MKQYFIKRLTQSIALLLLIITITFFLFRILPGDPVRLLFHDPRITAEQQKRLSQLFGLDKPLHIQYYFYMINTLKGDLGTSFRYREPVISIVSKCLLNTIILVVPATVLAIFLGGVLGAIASWKRETKVDSTILGFSLLFWSTPAFWLGMGLILVFVGILPISGMYTAGAEGHGFFTQLHDLLSHLLLPGITLTLILQAQFTIIMRNSLLDVMTEDYITTARSRGFKESTILRKYAVPNAMLPMTTLIAINLGVAVGGAVQTETVFSWPGLGRLMYDSIIMRDYPLLQGSFLIFACSVLAANFVADILYAYLDPRIKY